MDMMNGDLDTTEPLKLAGHVGFDSLPNQLVNRSVQNGFSFTILSIGETGVGKSTLADSLFNTRFDNVNESHFEDGVRLKANTYDLQESNVNLTLTLVDTVGYGDQINKEDSCEPIVDYIDRQFEAYLQEELKIKRNLSVYRDSRVHVCLYFVTPYGHGLKSIDLVCMKKLCQKVNIIPIIAKADTVTRTELTKLKNNIRNELRVNGVNIYRFPLEDETVAVANGNNNKYLPFAVMGSNHFVKVGFREVRARQYPWGVVEVENENHCDFTRLREMLIRTNMEDLCNRTHSKHYELYRQHRLKELGFKEGDQEGKVVASLVETCTLRRQNNLHFLKEKEDEMRLKFIGRVKEKEEELKEAEKELHAKYDELKQMISNEKEVVHEQKKNLDEKIADFQRMTEQYEAEKRNSGHQTLGWNQKK